CQNVPDRRERSARDLPAIGALRRAVHQYWLQRLEEVAAGIAEAIVTLSGGDQFVAERSDQLLEARKVLAFQMQPLEFGKQPPAHWRRRLRRVLFGLFTVPVRLPPPMASPSSCTFSVRRRFSLVIESLKRVNSRRRCNRQFDRSHA